MAHNTTIGTTGDVVTDYDLATGGAYPTTGKVPSGVIYVSPNATTAPTPVTAANGLYVQPGTSTAWNVVPAAPSAGAYLPVRITDGSAFIGSGTEYSEGDTATTPKGSAIFWVSGTTAHVASTANPLPVAVPGSVAVTGTFWQATQPVSGTVTANAGTGTFAVSAASLPLPAGAATAAKQAAPGTAGTASADVLTVQGVASMTALKVDGSAVTQPVSLASVPSHAVTNAGTFAVQASQAGTWTVTGAGGTFPVTGTFWQATQPVSLAALPALATGANAIGSITNTSFAVTQATGANLHTVVDSGTITTVSAVTAITNALPAGSNTLGGVNQAGTWTVQPGNTANTTPWLVSNQAATAGGASLPYAFLSTAAVQAASVKASAGQVYGLHFFNLNATPVYVRLYNLATSPATTDTPVYRAIVPGNTAGAGFVVALPPGIAFGTGIGIRVTGAIADNDATALAANTVVGNVFYK